MPQNDLVNISIYDLMGRSVKTLVSSNQIAGNHSVRWDATDDAGAQVSAGMYLYVVQTSDFSQSKKMIFLK